MKYKKLRVEIKQMKDNDIHELIIFESLKHNNISQSDLINLIFGLI